MKKAISVVDLMYARSNRYKKRLERALTAIKEAIDAGESIGVSYSGGKDSTVTLHLVRTLLPHVPVGFYDSGTETEFDQTYDMVNIVGATSYKSQIDLAEMCRIGGYWGYENASNPDAEFDFFAFVVSEPSIRFATQYNLTTMTMGLRAGENYGRMMSYTRRGEFYAVKENDLTPITHHLCPLGSWKDDDVWAYLAINDVPYNGIYDLMTEHGVPRRDQRVGMLLGQTGSGIGRYAILRAVAPEKYYPLVAQFPKIGRLT